MTTPEQAQLEITLLQSTPLYVAMRAIRHSRDTLHNLDTYKDTDELGPNDHRLIKRILDAKHESTLEHLYYSFEINNISRACLMELTRHRIASYTVRSTRYTLRKHKEKELPELYLSTGDSELDKAIEYTIKKMLKRLNNGQGYTNDELKYLIPESWATSLVMSINARSFRNFLQLRLPKSALSEIRKLAYYMYETLPAEHKQYLYDDIIERCGYKNVE